VSTVGEEAFADHLNGYFVVAPMSIKERMAALNAGGGINLMGLGGSPPPVKVEKVEEPKKETSSEEGSPREPGEMEHLTLNRPKRPHVRAPTKVGEYSIQVRRLLELCERHPPLIESLL